MADYAERMNLYRVKFKGKDYFDYVAVPITAICFEDVIRVVRGCWSWSLDIVSLEYVDAVYLPDTEQTK